MVRRRADLAAAARKGVRSPEQLAEFAALHPEATRRLVAAAAAAPLPVALRPAPAPATTPGSSSPTAKPKRTVKL